MKDKSDESKKEYSTPHVVVYGDLAELTKSGGAGMPDGTGGTKSSSDRNSKENFAAVDVHSVLTNVARLSITQWNYKNRAANVRHIGPMAQDFAASFRVGDSDQAIYNVDADGVALASIQALYAMVQQRDAEIDALKQEVSELKQRI